MSHLWPWGDPEIVRHSWRGDDGIGCVWPGMGPTLYGSEVGPSLSTPCTGAAHEEYGAYCSECRGTGRVAPAPGWDRSDIP